MRVYGFRLWLAMLFCISSALWAAEYQIFSARGEAHADYNNILPSLNQNDVLVFSKGERFRVTEILGHGNTTLILRGAFEDEGKTVALRMPLFQGYFSAIRGVDYDKRRSYLRSVKQIARKRLEMQDDLLRRSSPHVYTDFLNSTIDTQREYLALGAPVLPVLRESRNEYLAVPVIEPHPKFKQALTLDDLLKDKVARSYYPEALAALPELARRMARVSQVGDFGLRQFNYDFENKQWVLTDWLGYPGRTRGFGSFGSKGHPLIVAISVHDKELSTKLEKIMDQEKARLRGVGGSCLQALRSFFVGI